MNLISTITQRFSQLARALLNKPSRRHWLVAGLVIFIFVVSAQAAEAQAGFLGLPTSGAELLGDIAWLFSKLAWLMNKLLIEIGIPMLAALFKLVVSIRTPVVELGWVITRDLANIAIVVGLILLAGQAVFRHDRGFSAGKSLIILILAALAINFSRLIAGVVIDFGQVIMQTFVNAFQDIMAGSLTFGFAIEDLVTLGRAGLEGKQPVTGDLMSSILGAVFLQIIMLGLALFTIFAYIFVLLERLITLWVLVIFAPFAYASMVLPGTRKFISTWWSKFTSYVFIGPALAFMFWLALAALANTTGSGLLSDVEVATLASRAKSDTLTPKDEVKIRAFANRASDPVVLANFFAAVGILTAGVAVAQGLKGSAAVGKAGAMFGKLEKFIPFKKILAPAFGIGTLLTAGPAIHSAIPALGGVGAASPSAARGPEAASQQQFMKLREAQSEYVAKQQKKRPEATAEALQREFLDSKKAQRQATKPVGFFQRRRLGISRAQAKAGAQAALEQIKNQGLHKYFAKGEAQQKRVEAASKTGVTGGSGKYNIAATGFSELNAELSKTGHKIKGLGNNLEGAHLTGEAAVKAGAALSSILGKQMEALQTAKDSGNKQKQADLLANFGIKASVDDPDLGRRVDKALRRGAQARARFENEEHLKKNGLNLMNKERITGAGLGLARHERTHELVGKRDLTGASAGIKQRAHEYLKDRTDYNAFKHDEQQVLEEYAAGLLGEGRDKVKDDEYMSFLGTGGTLGASVKRRMAAMQGSAAPGKAPQAERLRLSKDKAEELAKHPDTFDSVQRLALFAKRKSRLNRENYAAARSHLESMAAAIKRNKLNSGLEKYAKSTGDLARRMPARADEVDKLEMAALNDELQDLAQDLEKAA